MIAVHTWTYKYDYNADGFPTIRYMSDSYMSDNGELLNKNKEYTYKEYTFEIDE